MPGVFFVMTLCDTMSYKKQIYLVICIFQVFWSSSKVPENTAVIKVKWVFSHVNEIFGRPNKGGGWRLDQPVANSLVNHNYAMKPL